MDVYPAVDGSGSDALSLTLPKQTSRSRSWRPKKPDPRRLWDLAWCALLSVFAILDWIGGEWISALGTTVLASICWRQFIVTRNQPAAYRRLNRLYLAVWAAVMIEVLTIGR